MFWEKRKEKAAKYKVENENLAVPEIHLKGDDDADPAEVCGEDQDIVYENVAVPEIHIGKKVGFPFPFQVTDGYSAAFDNSRGVYHYGTIVASMHEADEKKG